MPCPYFLPLRPFGPGPWDPPPRLPLNDAWQGECHAAEPFEPLESEQRELCNSGYARGQCPHFSENADAVRFSYVGEDLIYILEKDHAPIEHGPVERAPALVQAQARAFVQSSPQGRPNRP